MGQANRRAKDFETRKRMAIERDEEARRVAAQREQERIAAMTPEERVAEQRKRDKLARVAAAYSMVAGMARIRG